MTRIANSFGMAIGSIGFLVLASVLLFSFEEASAIGYSTMYNVSGYHTASFAEVDLTNTVDGSPVGDGTYLAWCVEQEKGLDTTGSTIYAATLYDSYDNDVSNLGFSYGHDWNRINYVLNHKTVTFNGNQRTLDWSEMQQTIWHFCGYTYTGGHEYINALISDANSNGADYVPAVTGEVTGFVLYVDGTHQTLVIEVPYTPPPPPENDNGCDGWNYWDWYYEHCGDKDRHGDKDGKDHRGDGKDKKEDRHDNERDDKDGKNNKDNKNKNKDGCSKNKRR